MRPSRLLSKISILPIIVMACGGRYTILTSTAPTIPVPTVRPAPTTVTQAQGIALPHGWTLATYTAAVLYTPQQWSTKATEFKVSAGCQPGERMVGAGYAATDVFEYNATIFTSYPSDDHTWVASGGTQAGIELDVYCLHGDHLPTVAVVKSVSGAVACPAGSALLAEGFGPAAEGATTWPTYALCATSGVEAGTKATAPVTFDSNHNGYMAAHASVSCPAGQIAFGGGATVVHTFASGASADFTRWDITGGGEGSGAVYADCVRLL